MRTVQVKWMGERVEVDMEDDFITEVWMKRTTRAGNEEWVAVYDILDEATVSVLEIRARAEEDEDAARDH